MATGGIGMTSEEVIRQITETPEQRESRRFRSLEALEKAGLLTFQEGLELRQMRRQHVLRSVR